jgi:O-antigen/teichoic acid export membrane protein
MRSELEGRDQETAGAPASLGRNIAVKALSEVAVKGGRLVLLVAAARVWAPESFGVFIFAGSFATMLTSTADFGLQLQLARAIAQGEGAVALGAAVRAKLVLSALTLSALGIAVAFYPRREITGVLLVAGGALLAQSWCELWNHYFRGRRRLREEAGLNLLYVVGGSLLGLVVLGAGGGVLAVYFVLLLAALAGSVVGAARVRALVPSDQRALPLEAAAGCNGGVSAWAALREAFPIGLAVLLSTIYFRLDMILLERMRGDVETAIYGAASRLLESAFVVPALVLAAVFPELAERARVSRAELTRFFRGALAGMATLGTCAAVAFAVAGPPLVRVLYGPAYADAGAQLRLLAPALCFFFPTYLLMSFLIAMGEQRSTAWFAAAGIVINLALNLALIPAYGARGAIVATIATEAALVFGAWFLAERRIARQPAVAQGVAG